MTLRSLLQALRNHRFRWLLLGIVSLGVVPLYVYVTVIGSIYAQLDPGTYNDGRVYLEAAQALAAGHDPYRFFVQESSRGVDPALEGSYIYPPLLAWAIQPVLRLGFTGERAVLLALDQLCLFLTFYFSARAIGVRSRQRLVMFALLVLGFFPNWENMIQLQLNPVIGLLTTLWAYLWSRGRTLSALPLGLGVALKLLQAPLFLLPLLRRRWGDLLVGAAVIAGLTLVAAPSYLAEYLTRVLPLLAGGSPNLLNQSPAAVFLRVAHPRGLYISVNYGTPALGLRLAWVAFAGAIVLLASWRLLRPASDTLGRLAEANLMVAAGVLLSTIVWAPYTALLTLPLLLCFDHAWRRRNLAVGVLAAFFYLALGPFHLLFINVVGAHAVGCAAVPPGSGCDPGVLYTVVSDRFGGGWNLILQLWALTGPLALIALFAACVLVHRAALAEAVGEADKPEPPDLRRVPDDRPTPHPR